MILRSQDKKEILDIAKKVFKTPLEILAYGSRVDGTAHDTSDLDLVLRSKDLNPINKKEWLDFKNQIENSNIPIIVQLFDWAVIPEHFQKQILKNHIVFYKTEG